MANTGYLIYVYQDINKNSPTYGQTKEEKQYDTEFCGLDTPNWVETSRYCEIESDGFQTGYIIIEYTDENTVSSTYGQTKVERNIDNVTCPVSSRDPEWVVDIDSPAYCETKTYEPSGAIGNSGIQVVTVIDSNQYSPTSGTTQQQKVENLEACPVPDTDPNWVEESRSCHIIKVGNGIMFDGRMDVIQRDKNEYSSSWDTTRTIQESDATNCPPSNTSPEWQYLSSYCETDSEGKNTGYAVITEKDVNPLSDTYGNTQTSTRNDTSLCPLPPTEPEPEKPEPEKPEEGV